MLLPNFAIIGNMGAGKTTVAKIMLRDYGYTRLSFATPLKAGCGTTTDREVLQRVGVGVRELCPDFWVNLLLAELLAELKPRGRYVVDDCRFPNEAKALRLKGFQFLRVVAPRNTRVMRLRASHKLQDEAQLEHVSETALDDFGHDHRIVNDDWPDRLEARVQDLLNKVQR